VTGLTHRSMQIAHFRDSSNMLALAVPSATGAAAAAGAAGAPATPEAFTVAAAVVASAETATAALGLTSPVWCRFQCFFFQFE